MGYGASGTFGGVRVTRTALSVAGAASGGAPRVRPLCSAFRCDLATARSTPFRASDGPEATLDGLTVAHGRAGTGRSGGEASRALWWASARVHSCMRHVRKHIEIARDLCMVTVIGCSPIAYPRVLYTVAMVMVSGVVAPYYNMIVAWAFVFLFHSFTSTLPW